MLLTRMLAVYEVIKLCFLCVGWYYRGVGDSLNALLSQTLRKNNSKGLHHTSPNLSFIALYIVHIMSAACMPPFISNSLISSLQPLLHTLELERECSKAEMQDKLISKLKTKEKILSSWFWGSQNWLILQGKIQEWDNFYEQTNITCP